MYVNDLVLDPVRKRFGAPRELALELEIFPAEAELVRHSTAKGRHHDVTFFVLHGDGLALIQKPHYEPGLWRPPGGGLRPHEDFVEGTRREAQEELGVEIELVRYLVSVTAVFRIGGEANSRGALMSSRLRPRPASSPPSTRTRSPPRAMGALPSWRGRSGIVCSRPGGRSGATGSPCTTRRSRRSRAEPVRSYQEARLSTEHVPGTRDVGFGCALVADREPQHVAVVEPRV